MRKRALAGGLLSGIGDTMIGRADQKRQEALEKARAMRDEQTREADRTHRNELAERQMTHGMEMEEFRHENALERDQIRYDAQLSAAQLKADAKTGETGQGIGYSAEEARTIKDIQSKHTSVDGKLNTGAYVRELRELADKNNNPRFAEIADNFTGRGETPPIMSREDAEAQVRAEERARGGFFRSGAYSDAEREQAINKLMWGDQPQGGGGQKFDWSDFISK